jgi:2,3-bisphosphoglycerate-independent phosphoglycerate mutase
MQAKPHSHGGLEMADAVRVLYSEGQTDYSLEPIVRVDTAGQPIGRVQAGDAVIFCCRRGEREVELTEAFVQKDFPHFERPRLDDLNFVILTLYHEKFKDLPVAFAPSRVPETLAEIVSRAGLRQLHIAESEKYAHVTFFFNGGNNQAFSGEDDVRIPSPKGIAFDQAPELSLAEVSQRLITEIQQDYALIVTNFANGDVIGHTSNRQAKIDCARLVDQHLGKVVQAATEAGMVVLVTADHGNLEELLTEDGKLHVSHTTNLVKFILVDPRQSRQPALLEGRLADVAPTILAAMGIPQPAVMDGRSLAPGAEWGSPRRVLLIILDGWGIGKPDDSNPIQIADTPTWDALLRDQPNCNLQASGEAVGLQAGKAGNSEAGHLNLGAGRVVLQDDVRLDQALKDGTFCENEVFKAAIEDVKKRGSSLHLIGLLTEKSSHGSIDYPVELVKMAKAHGLQQVFVHIIFDGRSTEPGSAPALLEKLEHQLEQIGLGQIATGTGRGIALDRDGNYAKIKKTYAALTAGIGRIAGAG